MIKDHITETILVVRAKIDVINLEVKERDKIQGEHLVALQGWSKRMTLTDVDVERKKRRDADYERAMQDFGNYTQKQFQDVRAKNRVFKRASCGVRPTSTLGGITHSTSDIRIHSHAIIWRFYFSFHAYAA